MTYVKKSALILLVDDSEIEKYQSNGFEVFGTPTEPKTQKVPKVGVKDGKSSK